MFNLKHITVPLPTRNIDVLRQMAFHEQPVLQTVSVGEVTDIYKHILSGGYTIVTRRNSSSIYEFVRRISMDIRRSNQSLTFAHGSLDVYVIECDDYHILAWKYVHEANFVEDTRSVIITVDLENGALRYGTATEKYIKPVSQAEGFIYVDSYFADLQILIDFCVTGANWPHRKFHALFSAKESVDVLPARFLAEVAIVKELANEPSYILATSIPALTDNETIAEQSNVQIDSWLEELTESESS